MHDELVAYKKTQSGFNDNHPDSYQLFFNKMKLSLALTFANLVYCTPQPSASIMDKTLQAYLIVDFNHDLSALKVYTRGERMEKMIKLRGKLMTLKNELDAAAYSAEEDQVKTSAPYKNFLKFHRQ